MIKANELRINNILNYTTAENDILLTTLDWQDIKWISEDEKGFNLVHKPIPLTEEWLLKFGAVLTEDYFKRQSYLLGDYNIYTGNEDGSVTLNDESGHGYTVAFPKYVHQLQNLYFALTGQELELK